MKTSLFRHPLNNIDPRYTYSSGLCVDLKVPLLLMTATFDNTLLDLLQKMIGIKVVPQNYLWAGKVKMSRRHIKLNVSITFKRSKEVKDVLKYTLRGNINKKVIVYTNTAEFLETLRSDIESWLDLSDDIKGDIIVIQGNLQPEVKFVSAEQFTRSVDNIQAQGLLDNNQFYPRILLATASCIGAGLDSPDVYSVCRIGFPSSVIDLVQEMGRCGRGRSSITGFTDDYFLKLSLDDFVYLNQRLYLPQAKNSPSVVTILSDVETIKMQRSRLLDLLRMIVLKGDCWHKQLEEAIGNPLEPPAIDLTSCGDACPVCCQLLSDYILPISRPSLSLFLADVFIINPGSDLSPTLVIQKLTKYDKVGTTVYCRPRSTKPPSPKFIQTTILQLIASNIVTLSFDEVTNDPRCSLTMIDAKPAYLDDSYWVDMYLADIP